jgi:hypothetical protein
MLPRRLEEVAMNAWPALQQMLFDSWIVRFAQGYTKRANFVNPLFESHLDVVGKIAACERLFAAKDLPTVFRLTPFVLPPQLDEVLAQRSYGVIDQTLVMHLDIQQARIQGTSRVTLRRETLRLHPTTHSRRPFWRMTRLYILAGEAACTWTDAGASVPGAATASAFARSPWAIKSMASNEEMRPAVKLTSQDVT